MKKQDVFRLFGVASFLLFAGFLLCGNVFAQNEISHIDTAIKYMSQGYYDQAISELNKALQINPNSEEAYFRRGTAYREKGIATKDVTFTDQAISDYGKALSLGPTQPHKSAMYIGIANGYHDKGDLDSAISNYNNAISADQSNELAFESRGLMYLKKGNLDQAIYDYTKAIGLKPGNANLYTSRASAYLQKGGTSDGQALSDFSSAIRLDPGQGFAYYGRSLIYYSKKQYKDALNDANKAKELGFNVPNDFLDELKKVLGSDK